LGGGWGLLIPEFFAKSNTVQYGKCFQSCKLCTALVILKAKLGFLALPGDDIALWSEG